MLIFREKGCFTLCTIAHRQMLRIKKYESNTLLHIILKIYVLISIYIIHYTYYVKTINTVLINYSTMMKRQNNIYVLPNLHPILIICDHSKIRVVSILKICLYYSYTYSL